METAKGRKSVEATVRGASALAPYPSDQALARRASMGDREAFAILFERHSSAVFRYALNMLDGNAHDAQDATQEAWIKAWRKLSDFRGESAVRTWLFRIVGREVLSARRRHRPVVVDDSLLAARARPAPDAAQEASDLELWEALAIALAQLPWRQRASWLLREYEGMSYDEIARVLETTPTVVRGQLHRARRTLAIRMEQWR